MSDKIAEIKSHIEGVINKAYEKAAAEGLLPSGAVLIGTVEIPRDKANGDYAANHAMVGARALRSAPKKIADTLVANMDLASDEYITSAEVAGPGFINFRISHKWYEDVIWDINRQGKNFCRLDTGKGKTVNVEFVSANPTGPMHMGNARGGVLGDALASVLEMAGYTVFREFYVNDAGNQIAKFAKSIDARYKQLILGEDKVVFPEDGYQGYDIKVLAEEFRAEFGDDMLNGDEEIRRDKMAEFGLKKNIPSMQDGLKRYGIDYDRWFFESELHNSNFVAETVDKLNELGYIYEKDGALWLKTAEIMAENLKKAGKSDTEIEKLELKDDVLRRANGFYTYFAADIAYHRNKLENRKFDIAINVWGADHHGHVARLKGALDALGLDGEHRLQIVLMQLVKLLKNGEAYKMSKRTGKAVSLIDLLDEIPVDAARFFFNARPDTPVEFDLDLAVRSDSENPVYYVQYAHARICTMLKALAEGGHPVPAVQDAKLELLTEPSETDLIKTLSALPQEIEGAAANLDPSRINKYVTELATKFHKFYTDCRIKDAETELMNARLVLTDTVRQVLEISLNLIGVSAPEKM